MKKTIIFSAGVFAAGLGIGYIIGALLEKKKSEEKYNEIPREVHLEYYDDGNVPVEDPDDNSYETELERIEKVADETESVFSVKDGKIAVGEERGINYRKYNELVEDIKKDAESEFPKEDPEVDEEVDEDEIPEDMYETETERIEREQEEVEEEMARFKKEHAGKIEMLRKEQWDTDFPEEDYDRAELYYFPDDEELTDEDGEVLDPMEEWVGDILQKVGFINNEDEEIYIRNNIKECNYRIHKEIDITKEEFFG